MRLFLASVLFVGMTTTISPAKAADYDYRPDAKRITLSIDQGGLIEETQGAMDSLVAQGVAALRAQGQNQQADRIAREWKLHLHTWMQGGWDLGDHDPLLPWLRKTYLDMEKYLGAGLMAALYLTDIHILNHAIPIVFNPRGRDWDRAEYRKHFVPMAGVITYWGTFLGCRFATDWAFLQSICRPAANAAKWWMTSYAGASLSDRVYRQFVSTF